MIRLCVLAAVGLVINASSAKADFVHYSLTAPNTDINGYTGPFGFVEVNRTSTTTATITFISNIVGGNIYLFGDGGSADVNVNATSWTIGPITVANSGTGFSPGPLADDGSKNVSTFGTFNQTTKNNGGFTNAADYVSFTLTNTSGTWATAADVLTPNSDGYTVAAHIFITSYPANASNGAIVTGFASNGSGPEPGPNPNPVPAPAGLILLASAVPMLALRRAFRRKLAV